jgi:hypothetical protein
MSVRMRCESQERGILLGPGQTHDCSKRESVYEEGLWLGSPGTEEKKVFGEN